MDAAPRPQMAILHDTPPLRIGYQQGTVPTLVVCFSSVGTERNVMPPFEFVGAATAGGRHGLFISDIGRSWMNGAEIIAQTQQHVAQIRATHGITQIIAMGLSMGGFNALIAPRLFDVTRVIAFAPQYSLHPDIMPQERRWRYWQRQIDPWRFESAEPIVPTAQTFIFHGLKDDAHHALAFPAQPNLDHYFFPGFDHTGLTHRLKQRGLLARMVDHALEGRRTGVARIVKRMGGNFRSRYGEQFDTNIPPHAPDSLLP